MRKIVINGGRPLKGEVTISGAKNSVVALIPAIILADGIVTLDGVPAISDVDSLIVLRLIRARFKVWRCLMVKSIASALPIISTEVF